MRGLIVAIACLLVLNGYARAGQLAPGSAGARRSAGTAGGGSVIGPEWFARPVSFEDWPVDVSFLNEKPAGRHGFLGVKDGDFVFEDGTPARFWSMSLSNTGNFVGKDAAPRVARRRARLGFNMVRLHHMDAPWCRPPTGLVDYKKGNSRNIDPAGLDRIDYLISCLKKEGIYVHLDMYVSRKFVDGDGLEKAGRMDDAHKAYAAFVPKAIELQKEYCDKLWKHRNPYTGLEYRRDPAIALTLVINEMDHLNLNQIWRQKLEPHWTVFGNRSRAFAKKRGYDEVKSFNMWDHYEGKEWINELLSSYFIEMRGHMRSIGVKVPVTGSNWLRTSMDLPSQATMDFMDTHRYGGTGLDVNPLRQESCFAKAALSHVMGRPLVISEYNTYWPHDRASMALSWAAIAALQGWDSPVCFSYCAGFGAWSADHITRPLEFGLDPARLAPMPAAALLFRRGDVALAEETVAVFLDKEHVYGWKGGFGVSGERMAKGAHEPMTACRTGVEQHRVVVALLKKPTSGDDISRVVTPETSLLPAGAKEVVSDTGEIRRNWGARVQLINTPRTQAAQGYLKAYGRVRLEDVTIVCRSPFAVIAVSSLSDAPLREADELLITTVANAQNTGMTWRGDKNARKGRGPTVAEPVEADIVIAHRAARLTVVPLRVDGSGAPEVPVEKTAGGFRFTVAARYRTLYYKVSAGR